MLFGHDFLFVRRVQFAAEPAIGQVHFFDGLLMVWVDVDPEYEAELHRWYDEEHIQRLLSVPGFRSAGRYVALKGGPKNLVLYELESIEVLHTAAFLDEVRPRSALLSR